MESPERIRGAILHILKLFLERDRVPGDDEDGYMLEGNLQAHLAQYYRINLTEGLLRGHMTLLKDRDWVKYKETRTGLPPRVHVELLWRITGDGLLIASGERHDDLVAVPKW